MYMCICVVYAALMYFLLFFFQFGNWTFTLVQSHSFAATYFGMLPLDIYLYIHLMTTALLCACKKQAAVLCTINNIKIFYTIHKNFTKFLEGYAQILTIAIKS